MQLTEVTLYKYKSIEQEQTFAVEEDVTILVGMNESGKTATLEALAKSNYFNADKAFKYNATHDYPRKEKKKMDKSGEVPASISCTYLMDNTTLGKIEEDLGKGVFSQTSLEVSYYYNNTPRYEKINLNLENFIDNVLAKFQVQDASFKKKLLEAFNSEERIYIHEYFAEYYNKDSEEEDLEIGIENALHYLQKYIIESYEITAGRLEDYILKQYLIPALPKFLYYDEYYMLPSRISLEKLKGKTLKKGELKTAKALLALADLDIDKILRSDDFEDFVAELEATQADISEELFQYWTTNTQLDIEFRIDKKEHPIKINNRGYQQESTIVEHILDIRVKNTQKRISLPLKNRSKGFNWFFSFLVWFKRIQEDKNSSYIILLDEPGLNLHAAAQADLLRFIEDLAPNYQILYTTHSPFMVPSDKLHRVRTVLDTKGGTRISNSIQEKDPNTLFPLQAALGYDIAQNLFIAKKNLLIEGVSDLVFLQTMSNILETAGRTGLNQDIVLVPTGGLDKVATFISLMRGSSLEVVCLLDSFTDPKGKAKLDNHIKSKIIKEKKVRFFDEFVNQAEADIEDLFTKKDYLKLFNASFEQYNDLEEKDLIEGIPRIIMQVEKYLQNKGKLTKNKRFNHYQPANQLAKMGVEASYFETATLEQFEQCFKTINSLF